MKVEASLSHRLALIFLFTSHLSLIAIDGGANAVNILLYLYIITYLLSITTKA